jgi:uncharacterized cupin superfamily protein
MDIEIKKLSPSEIESRGIKQWPIWEKEASRFPWTYGEPEECYLLEGRVTVETQDGKKVDFGKGDYVRFPAGLKCTWDIQEPVRKHYSFG